MERAEENEPHQAHSEEVQSSQPAAEQSVGASGSPGMVGHEARTSQSIHPEPEAMGHPPTMEQIMRAWFTAVMAGQGAAPVQAPPGGGVAQAVEATLTLGKCVRELRDLGCKPFLGQADPEKALSWLLKLETTLEEAEIPASLRVRAATQLLEESAHTWWATVRTRLPESNPVTWTEFRAVFEDQYYTRMMRRTKEREFLDLRQGTLSVLQYERRFQELLPFAGHIVQLDRERVERFAEGLRPELRSAVISMVTMGRTIREVVETAESAERAVKELSSVRMPPPAPRVNPGQGSRFSRPQGGAQLLQGGPYGGRKRNFDSVAQAGSQMGSRVSVPRFLPCPRCG